MRKCEFCGEDLPLSLKSGRSPKYCSGRCRTAAWRARKSLPRALVERDRWIRWGRLRGERKCPLSSFGAPLNVKSEWQWMSFEDARDAEWGEGVGFVLIGDGVMCIDLDDCVKDGVVDPAVRPIVDAAKHTYVEVSPSGTGLHIWGFGEPGRGRVFRVGRVGVEVYSQARYITVTRDRLPGCANVLRSLDDVLEVLGGVVQAST